MEKWERDVITLINCSLNGGTPILSGDISLGKLLKFCVDQQLCGLVYPALKRIDNIAESEEFKRFKNKCESLSNINVRQLFELKSLNDLFNQNGIEHMFLKGSVLKNVYPMPEMRAMGDIDVLIRESEKDKILDLMKENGYEFFAETDHEFIFKTLPVCVELHKRLIPSHNVDYNRYYEDSWKFAKHVGSSEYAMNDEDFFVYILTHFAKHYRNKGAGIKYIVDFYVFLKAKPSIDREYIERELEKLKLLEFYKNILYLIEVWFYGGEESELSLFLTDKVFSSGVYGINDQIEISDLIKISKKHRNYRFFAVLRLAFPSVESMKSLYPVLKKCIILLPFLYPIRIISKLFQPQKMSKAAQTVKRINSSPDKVEKYKQELNYVGLDYNFYDEE